jgi:hypothetical protein
MRFKLVIATAAILGLAACGDRDAAAGNEVAVDQGFSTENTAANDLTAIDAATADASGMAADAEANLMLEDLGNETDGNLPANVTRNED